jgi:hypothetical protein
MLRLFYVRRLVRDLYTESGCTESGCESSPMDKSLGVIIVMVVVIVAWLYYKRETSVFAPCETNANCPLGSKCVPHEITGEKRCCRSTKKIGVHTVCG